jgi:hypothetical protein
VAVAILAASVSGCFGSPPPPSPPAAEVAISDAALLNSDPTSGRHADFDTFILHFNVTVNNTGGQTLKVVSLKVLFASGDELQASRGTLTQVEPGASANTSVDMLVASNLEPRTLFVVADTGVSYQATFPPLDPPGPEADIIVTRARWVDAPRDPATTATSSRYLWLDANIGNRYNLPINFSGIATFPLFVMDYGNFSTRRPVIELDGPTILDPGEQRPYNLTFAAPTDPGNLTLFFESRVKVPSGYVPGPWSKVKVDASPDGVLPFNDPQWNITGTSWVVSDGAQFHTHLGYYMLALDVTVTNYGVGPFDRAMFNLSWADGVVNQAPISRVWNPLQTQNFRLLFQPTVGGALVEGTKVPANLSFSYGTPLHNQTTRAIPDPGPVPIEVDISNVTSAWVDYDPVYLTPLSGDPWLLVEFDLHNNWTGPLVGDGFQAINASQSRAYPRYVSEPLGPGNTTHFLLFYNVNASFGAVMVVYQDDVMTNGPWGRASVPSPNRTIHGFEMEITIHSAVWRYESAAGYHTTSGNYSLWLNFTLVNHGKLPLSVQPAAFYAWWQGVFQPEGSKASFASFSLLPGATVDLEVSFDSEGLQVPERLGFYYYASQPTFDVPIPAPSGPAPEVILAITTASSSQYGLYNNTASAGFQFLWFNVTVENRWNLPVDTQDINFDVADTNGSRIGAQWVVGPTSLAVNATQLFTVIFYVPDTWGFALMWYEMVAGPWASDGV